MSVGVIPYLILGIALVAGLLLAGRWYVSAEPRTLIKVVKWALVGLVGFIAVFFVVNGKLVWAIATLPALIPWFMRARSVARMAKTFSRMSQAAGMSAASGETSEVETPYLRMTLEHDSGRMTGEVLSGEYAGKRLEEMALGQLVELLKTCWRDDDESTRLLEAYLDREFRDWRETAKAGDQQNSSSGAVMDWAEALQILGLEEGASEDEIKEAHRRLIAGMHPDHGGSDYLAAQINRAKDLLLGE